MADDGNRILIKHIDSSQTGHDTSVVTGNFRTIQFEYKNGVSGRFRTISSNDEAAAFFLYNWYSDTVIVGQDSRIKIIYGANQNIANTELEEFNKKYQKSEIEILQEQWKKEREAMQKEVQMMKDLMQHHVEASAKWPKPTTAVVDVVVGEKRKSLDEEEDPEDPPAKRVPKSPIKQ